MDRWVILGTDAEHVASVAASLPAGIDAVATPGDVRTVAAGALAAGAQRFLVAGGDRDLHDLVAAVRATPPRDALTVRFPDDPMIEPTEHVVVFVAIAPAVSSGLARTIGIQPGALPNLGNDHAWGPLDVGILTLEGTEHVMVSHMEIAIDEQPTPGRFRRAPAPQVQLSLNGRRTNRLRAPFEPHHRGPEPLGWIAIANGQYMGDARIAPRAVPHDRGLDVLIGSGDARTVRGWRRAALHAAHESDAGIEGWLADAVQVRVDRPVRLRLDDRWLTGSEVSLRIERPGIALKV